MIDRLFEKALRVGGGTHTKEDIYNGLLSGAFQLFSTERAIVITEIMTTTGRFGFEKRLPNYGWKPAYTTFKYDLETAP